MQGMSGKEYEQTAVYVDHAARRDDYLVNPEDRLRLLLLHGLCLRPVNCQIPKPSITRVARGGAERVEAGRRTAGGEAGPGGAERAGDRRLDAPRS